MEKKKRRGNNTIRGQNQRHEEIGERVYSYWKDVHSEKVHMIFERWKVMVHDTN